MVIYLDTIKENKFTCNGGLKNNYSCGNGDGYGSETYDTSVKPTDIGYGLGRAIGTGIGYGFGRASGKGIGIDGLGKGQGVRCGGFSNDIKSFL